MIDKITIAMIGGTVIVSVGVLAFFDYRKKKIGEIAKNLSVDIPENILNRAINEAAGREAQMRMYAINNRVFKEYEDDIRNEVRKVVNSESDKLKPMVENEINKQINCINVDDIRREVVEKAKDKVARKFENDLDDILDKHNEELDKITRIYSSIADKLEGN